MSSSILFQDQLGDKFKINELIFNDGNSPIFRGWHRNQNKTMAIKFSPREHTRAMTFEGGVETSMEIFMLRKLKHVPEVVAYVDELVTSRYYIIMTEYLAFSSTLADFLGRSEKFYLTEDATRYIMKQVVNAVMAIDELGFMHGDLRVDNVMVHVLTLEIKIIDFSSARCNHPKKMRSIECPIEYAPQEWEARKKITCDHLNLFQLGLLAAMMLYNDPPLLAREIYRWEFLFVLE